MGTYITIENLFAFAQILLTLTIAVTGIITLVITIVQLGAARGNEKKRKK